MLHRFNPSSISALIYIILLFFRIRVENSVLSLVREPVPSAAVVMFLKRRWRRWTFSIFTVSTVPSQQRRPLKYGIAAGYLFLIIHIIIIQYYVRILWPYNIVLLPLLPTGKNSIQHNIIIIFCTNGINYNDMPVQRCCSYRMI